MVTGLHFLLVCEINLGERNHSHLTGGDRWGEVKSEDRRLQKTENGKATATTLPWLPLATS